MNEFSENYYELDRLFFKADNEIKEGLIVDAFDTLQYVVEQEPTYGKAYNHLGWIYETKYKNYSKAEECYRLAVKFAPEYTAAYINYAILLSNLEKYTPLAELLEKSLTVAGINKSKIWNEYGIMYEMQGNYTESVNAYKKAIQHSVSDEDIDRFEKSIYRVRKKQQLDTL
jgi:tetratricopeptide (TPR) repeat protein